MDGKELKKQVINDHEIKKKLKEVLAHYDEMTNKMDKTRNRIIIFSITLIVVLIFLMIVLHLLTKTFVS